MKMHMIFIMDKCYNYSLRHRLRVVISCFSCWSSPSKESSLLGYLDILGEWHLFMLIFYVLV